MVASISLLYGAQFVSRNEITHIPSLFLLFILFNFPGFSHLFSVSSIFEPFSLFYYLIFQNLSIFFLFSKSLNFSSYCLSVQIHVYAVFIGLECISHKFSLLRIIFITFWRCHASRIWPHRGNDCSDCFYCDILLRRHLKLWPHQRVHPANWHRWRWLCTDANDIRGVSRNHWEKITTQENYSLSTWFISIIFIM